MEVGNKKVGLKMFLHKKSSFQDLGSYCNSTKVLSSCPRSAKYFQMVSQQCKSRDNVVSLYTIKAYRKIRGRGLLMLYHDTCWR
jgi:hypothetical protein